MAEHNTTGNDDLDGAGDDFHFDDDDLEAALADFEKEFSGDDSSADAGDEKFPETDAARARDAEVSAMNNSGDGDMPSGGDMAGDDEDESLPSVADEAQEAADFEDELQGLLGNKAKAAVLITRLNSAELLAAFCHLADISAVCLPSAQGAVAVLRNLDGDSPEAAAKDLTRVVSGLGVVLAVNRADKLEATLYLSGEAGQGFAPPILFTSTAPFVEDLLLGISTVTQVEETGVHGEDTGKLSSKQAYDIISKYLNNGASGNPVW
ncbi:hypothetical protein [Bifidobacterium choloepi]|uniref:hypothetical protein n=1 Tax=Bifidobacterium choloepi TaxID=2614131 RepID=UPI0018C8AD13|nr:hypothetical protein [Bifidobacterium choloepi]